MPEPCRTRTRIRDEATLGTHASHRTLLRRRHGIAAQRWWECRRKTHERINMAKYDVIVVGARCAGAPTAMLLARKGYRVLLVDRSRFPSDIRHGHFIHRHGPRRLQAW